jgi:hypothetical protein
MTAALLAVALVASACSTSAGNTEEVKRATATTVASAGGSPGTIAPSSDTTPTTVVKKIAVANVGQTITTRNGNEVAVHALRWPLDVPSPDPTKVYAAADIEACSGANPKTDAGVAPQFFQLELANNTAWPAAKPVQQPALRPTTLARGHCVRGWVSFLVPRSVTPILVTLRTSTQAAWRVT